MPVLAWFIFRSLGQHGVRIHVNWDNTEWDATSTESTQKAPTITKISSFHIHSVDVESHSALTRLTWSLTWCWLSWQGMRLRINWVTSECWKIWISWRIPEQNRKHSKALLVGLYMVDQCKTPEQQKLTQVHLRDRELTKKFRNLVDLNVGRCHKVYKRRELSKTEKVIDFWWASWFFKFRTDFKKLPPLIPNETSSIAIWNNILLE